jgi:glycosyltransferase involved in cell wall biosynthesis
MAARLKIAILADFPAHLIPAFAEAHGHSGHCATTWLPQLAEAFEKITDLEVHWLVLSSLIKTTQRMPWRKQHFHILPTATKYRASTFFRKDRAAICQELAEINPDLVHGWGSEDVHGLAAATSGYPNIVSMQGLLSHYILQSKMAPREYFQALLELFIFWRADRITVESQWAAKRVKHRHPFVRLSVVEYGVQSQFFEAHWNPDPRKPLAIFVGTLCPRKGIQDLVAAFRDPRLAGASLWVVGDGNGPWVKNLREQASENIHWLGRRTNQETAALLAQAWCLVLPTRADTSPNVVKEARVIGMPVISTPCGGQSDYLEDGLNGYLVLPGDIPELTGKIASVLGDIDYCRQLGAHRHHEQRRFFDPELTAQSFHRLYQLHGRKPLPANAESR